MNVSGGITDTFRKLWRHSWDDWRMLFYAGGLTGLVRAALSVVSLRQVVHGLRRTAARLPQWKEATPTYRRQAVWAARTAGRRLLPERPCLTQALILQYLLLRRGDDSAQLHIGVAKREEEGFLAHAWVERDGDVLIGGPASPNTYERFDDLGSKIEPSKPTGPSPGQE